MATIRFEPRATQEQFNRFVNAFACKCEVNGLAPGMSVAVIRELDGYSVFPCNLTIDPTRPETWARAVYEAGKRDGTHMAGGVAKQPAKTPKFEPKNCRVCGKARTSTFDGRWFCHVACIDRQQEESEREASGPPPERVTAADVRESMKQADKPIDVPATHSLDLRSFSLVINGIEYRPVT